MDDEQQRKRVSKACDACRSKKVKCDGEEPCFNCTKSSGTCTYARVVKARRKPPTRVSNRKILADLSDRLSRLEDVLIQLRDGPLRTETVAIYHNGGSSSPNSDHFQSGSKGSSSYSEADSGSETSESETEAISQNAKFVQYSPKSPEIVQLPTADDQILKSDNNIFKSGVAYTPTNISAKENVHSPQYLSAGDGFLGAYSAFSMFSPKGMQWVHEKLSGDPEILATLLQIKTAICYDNFKDFNHYFEKIGIIDTYDFPASEVCETLFQAFTNYAAPIAPIEIKSEIPGVKEKFELSPRTLNFSELFFVDVVLLIGATVQCQLCSLSNQNPSRWLMVQTQMMLKTLQLYQQTSLAHSSDTLLYIKGVLLFCWQIENSSTPQLGYLLLSTAVRLAMEIGLHLRETYFGISDPKEALKRQSLWLNLYRYDIYLSIRTGKPTSIHEGDTSSLNDWDYYQYMDTYRRGVKFDLQRCPNFHETTNWLTDLDSYLHAFCCESMENLNFALQYYELKLVQYSSKCYRYLLTCRALAENDYKHRLVLVEKLNAELNEWQANLPDFLQPKSDLNTLSKLDIALDGLPERSSGSAAWSYIDTSPAFLRSRILNMHLEYYLSMLYTNCVLNRIPWFSDHSSRCPTKAFAQKTVINKEKCAFAARMMLKIGKIIIESSDPNISLKGNVFYSYFSGFLNLLYRCIEDPSAAKEDLLLLYETTMVMVGATKLQRNPYSLKWTIVGFTCLSLLKVLVVTYEAETKDKSLAIDLDLIQKDISNLQTLLEIQPKETLTQLRIIDEFHNNLKPSMSENFAHAKPENGASGALNIWFEELPKTTTLESENLTSSGETNEALGSSLNDIYSLAPNRGDPNELPLGSQDFDFMQFFSAGDPELELPSIFHF